MNEATKTPEHLGEIEVINGREWIRYADDPYRFMTVKHHFIGGIYTKEMRMPPGHRFDQHRHSYDHVSVLASGEALVDVEGVETKYTGPVVLEIKAKKMHSIMPITPCVWLCQHVTNCTDPDIVDDVIMNEGG